MYTKLLYNLYTVQYNVLILDKISEFEPLTIILRKDDIFQFENILLCQLFMLMNREMNYKKYFFRENYLLKG